MALFVEMLDPISQLYDYDQMQWLLNITTDIS